MVQLTKRQEDLIRDLNRLLADVQRQGSIMEMMGETEARDQLLQAAMNVRNAIALAATGKERRAAIAAHNKAAMKPMSGQARGKKWDPYHRS